MRRGLRYTHAMPLPWSTSPFGDALRAALDAQGMSFRDLESRCLVPVGNLHDHVSGKRGAPGDDLLQRIAEGARVDPNYFREWRLRRLEEALIAHPEIEVWMSRRLEADTFDSLGPRRRVPRD